MISLVKESNDLFEQALTEVKEAKDKISAFEADSKDAEALNVENIEKLCSIRIEGKPLIDEDDKQVFVEGLRTKKAMADMLGQVIDSFSKYVDSGESRGKAASLGEPSDRPQVTEQTPNGFASLPSRRVQM